MVKHLVTSGCSFSDNVGKRWPHYLSETLNTELYNRGQGSAGNDWISSSAIYQANLLLKQGIPSEDILVAVMWSGIDRKGSYINPSIPTYQDLLNRPSNPVSFVGMPANCNQAHDTITSGWLLGSAACSWDNQSIVKLKQEFLAKHYTEEWLMIESLNEWLKLQWFCKSNSLNLINLCYKNIWLYPNMHGPFWEEFPTTNYLYEMLDKQGWVFFNDYDGLYEWTIKNTNKFYSDGIHPLPESHKKYVNDFLYPRVKKLLE